MLFDERVFIFRAGKCRALIIQPRTRSASEHPLLRSGKSNNFIIKILCQTLQMGAISKCKYFPIMELFDEVVYF